MDAGGRELQEGPKVSVVNAVVGQHKQPGIAITDRVSGCRWRMSGRMGNNSRFSGARLSPSARLTPICPGCCICAAARETPPHAQ